MRLQHCLLVILWTVCSNYSNSLRVKPFRSKFMNRDMKLNLIDQVDPSTLNVLQNGEANVFFSSLTNGFYDASGRLVGTIVAGVLIKSITDSIFEEMNAPKQRREFNRGEENFKSKTVEVKALVDESKMSKNKLNIPLAAIPSLVVCILIGIQ